MASNFVLYRTDHCKQEYRKNQNMINSVDLIRNDHWIGVSLCSSLRGRERRCGTAGLLYSVHSPRKSRLTNVSSDFY